MTTPAGLGGQWGYVTESSVGTAATVNKFLPVLSSEIGSEIEPLESEGIRAGRLVTAIWKQGYDNISGTVEMELWNADIASLFKHMFGSVSVATNGSLWDYTYTPADLTGKSMTIQQAVPTIDGTVRPSTFTGCKVTGWSLTAEAGQIANLSLDIGAMTATNGISLASASYDAALAPFVFSESFLVIDGSTNAVIRQIELNCDTGLTDRPRLGSRTSQQYLQNGRREFTGTFTKDFESLGEYDKYRAGEATDLVLVFDNGSEMLEITTHVRYDGSTTTLGGVELPEESIPFKAFSTTNDASAVTAVLTAGDGFTGAA